MNHASDTPETPAQLRAFGLLMGAILVLLFGLFLPWLRGSAWPLWPWLLALPFIVLALARPRWLQPVSRLWGRIGAVLGWINTRVLLGVVFYFVILPIGLMMRLARDPLARRFDAQAPTYRRHSAQPVTRNLERPF